MTKAITTAFTRLLPKCTHLQVPIVGAPMAGAGGAKLAAEVTLGGAFGFIPAGYRDAHVLRTELDTARTLLNTPPNATLPLGVAYFGWKLKEQGEATTTEMLDVSLQHNVQAIWFSFWSKDQSKWARYIREKDAASTEERSTVIFVLVSSVEQALMAVNEWKADVIVAQGSQAGGHGSAHGPPLQELFASIVDAIPENRPPILVAGGLSNGSQVAEYLAKGADGAVLGTRFLLTPESTYTPGQKNALVAAKSNSTVRSVKFDEARNTKGWPEGTDGRGLVNALTNGFQGNAREINMDILREKVKEATAKDDPEWMVTWAGLGVGDMNEIKGAQPVERATETVSDILKYLEVGSLWLENVKEDVSDLSKTTVTLPRIKMRHN
ncbi:hypothetical protein EUX98_g1811 [Antrodiella citrinella]|uniref:Uncharacterized protein n=1 Tax=Antrodiella citrinella TaxID=2447956 RepID=A0A4S4N0K8_9APHY|nr:hypothetical protein EUX98_g1811 [Antrodiella citrinella]